MRKVYKSGKNGVCITLYQSDKYYIYILNIPTYIPTQLLNAPVLNKMLCVQIVCIGMS